MCSSLYLATILQKKKKRMHRNTHAYTQIKRHRKLLEQSQETSKPEKGNMGARRREIFTFHFNTILIPNDTKIKKKKSMSATHLAWDLAYSEYSLNLSSLFSPLKPLKKTYKENSSIHIWFCCSFDLKCSSFPYCSRFCPFLNIQYKTYLSEEAFSTQ